MSSRQLKKLRAQEEQKKALEAHQPSADAEEDDGAEASSEEDSPVVSTRARPKNAFAAFASLSMGDDDDNDDNDDDEAAEDGEAAPGRDKQQEAVEAVRPARKKRLKKKGKPTKTANAEDGTDEKATEKPAAPSKQGQAKKAKQPKTEEEDGLDEIDRALKELNIQSALGKSRDVARTTHAGEAGNAPRIKIDFHDLKVLKELRSVFGRDTIRAARADEASNEQQPRGERVDGNPAMVQVDLETYLRGTPLVPQSMGRRANAIVNAMAKKGMTDAVARRNPFIDFKDTWPRATSGGLSMQQVTPAAYANGVVEYTFVHTPAYARLDDTFFMLVQMHNHHPLIQFLKQNPYHISSLIQVSRVAKQDQNAALAADLCERALFSFGRSTLSSFRQKLGEGLARLSFRRPENRQFLLAGYYYIKSLVPRGTHRTALTWTKLFLSLMPDDDYGLMLWAHGLAVRAGEDQWLVDISGAEEGDGIPALQRNPMRAYLRQTLVVARLQLGDTAGARAALVQGLAQLPWLYAALFQALGLDVPRAVWGVQPRSQAEQLYTELYVQQAKDLWESSPMTSLLREVAATATRADAAAVAALPPAEPVTLNVARFVYLDGAPATMALVPGDTLHVTPNYDFDPLPPAQDDNVFSHPGQKRPWIVAGDEAAGMHQNADHLAVLRGLLAEGFDMGPGEGDIDHLLEEADFDGDEGMGDDNEDFTDEEIVVGERPERRDERSGPMPGAWVEDAEGEESD